MIFIILLIFTGTYNWVSTMTYTRLASYLPSGSILYQFDMVYITAESRRGNGLMSSALDFIFQVERSGFQTWRNSKQSRKSKQIAERKHFFRLVGGINTPCCIKPRDLR